jgi:glutamyl/glutaminyl-tRNA synthetase
MAHVPLILNSDKTKLSKRQGDSATEDFLRKGYLKEALINYMALLGWNPGEGEQREIYSLGEIIRLFSIDRVNSSGAVFNLEKLDWMNSEYIKNYDLNELAEMSIPYLKASGYDISDKEKTKRVITAVRTYINKLEDIGEASRIYYESAFELTEGQKKIVESEDSKSIISSLFSKIKNCDEMSVENFKTILSEIQREIGVKGKALFQPIRLVICGEEHGPDLGLIFFVLGKKEVVNRLARYMGEQDYQKNS